MSFARKYSSGGSYFWCREIGDDRQGESIWAACFFQSYLKSYTKQNMHSPCIEKTDWRAAEMYKQHKRLGDSNEIRNHNYLVRKQKLNHLAKLWLWIRMSCCHLNSRHGACFQERVPSHSGKLLGVNSLWNSYMTW